MSDSTYQGTVAAQRRSDDGNGGVPFLETSMILKTAVGHVKEYNPQRQLTEEVSIAERIRSN